MSPKRSAAPTGVEPFHEANGRVLHLCAAVRLVMHSVYRGAGRKPGLPCTERALLCT